VVRAERLVAGGEALARREDGRIVLVEGALPGERVAVTVTTRRGADRGALVRVVEPSPDRVRPTCAHLAAGCGGCDLMHLDAPAQVGAKVEMMVDALRRLGRWTDPVVRTGPSLTSWAYRTTMRFAVTDGRAGLRRGASHELVAIDTCMVAHPALDEVVRAGYFGAATEVTLRVGVATGDRLALVAPGRDDGIRLPDDVFVIGADELARGKRAWFHEEVAGRRWRMSAASFFQGRPDGAAALVDVVRSLAGDVLDRGSAGRPAVLIDAYSGVGLFAGSLLDGRVGWRAVCAEHSRSAVADARVNLADLDAKIVTTTVERLRVPRADLVVADPSRAGLGRRAVDALVAADADRLILVSCDPASAGRDARLLAERGYAPVETVVVDLFPHTHHVEAVTRFDRR